MNEQPTAHPSYQIHGVMKTLERERERETQREMYIGPNFPPIWTRVGLRYMYRYLHVDLPAVAR
jgi:hypothetical protein